MNLSHRYRAFLCCPRLLLAIAVLVATVRGAGAQDNAEVRAPTMRFVGADYSYVAFQDQTDPWHLTALSLGRRDSRGSLIGRVNLANRFSTTGTQFEIDAYPRLSRRAYAYLNAGYSSASIFPDWRSGGELFVGLPSAWEASAGYRQLRFGGAPVTLFTGAVGKYIGNYWFSARPYVRVRSNGTSASAGLTARRYYQDGDNYFGARASYGSAPADQATPDAVSRTDALSAAVQASRSLRSSLLGTASVGYDREELAPGRVRRGVTSSVGLRVRF